MHRRKNPGGEVDDLLQGDKPGVEGQQKKVVCQRRGEGNDESSRDQPGQGASLRAELPVDHSGGDDEGGADEEVGCLADPGS